MRNKWTKVAVIILVGIIAMGAAQTMGGGSTGDILNIVGFILVVWGIVEAFRKQKVPPTA
jgi:hypothetical protein